MRYMGQLKDTDLGVIFCSASTSYMWPYIGDSTSLSLHFSLCKLETVMPYGVVMKTK